MTDMNKLREAMEDAEADLRAAFAHKEKIMAELLEAETWVNEALKRDMEAQFAFRAAQVSTGYSGEDSK